MKRHFIVLFLLSFSSIALGYIDPRVPNGFFELPVEGGAKINRYTFDFKKGTTGLDPNLGYQLI